MLHEAAWHLCLSDEEVIQILRKEMSNGWKDIII